MSTLSQLPGRTAIINNEEYLFFSGYSYLGLGLNKEFTSLVKEGIDKYILSLKKSWHSIQSLKLPPVSLPVFYRQELQLK